MAHRSTIPHREDPELPRVALSGDSNTLAVGAVWEDSTATGIAGDQTNNEALASGAVYLY